ncbi:MAG TPA: amidohydrolase family protein [Thermoanaerobaculia bacterium]|jgi:beta-aspartyl-dipeptidase (metallo-type)
MLILENGNVYAPDPLGRVPILIAGGRIEKIGGFDVSTVADALECDVVDASGWIIAPGLIDPHAHLTGGSGEQGFATQTPEMHASELWKSGITTVVGTLGTDTTTKTLPPLLARVKALREEGLGAFMWTGGYDGRPLTSSMRDDVILIEEIIGFGEIAIADRRSLHYTALELARMATDCYVAGTLTGKAGVLHLHVGDGERRLAVLRKVLDAFEVRPSTLYPTHVERNEALMEEAIELTRRGVTIDLDVYEQDLGRWMQFYLERGGDLSRITASSDAAIKSPHMLFEQIRALVREGVLPLQQALAVATLNTARVLKLHDRGKLAPGMRADFIALDAESLDLLCVVCNGELVLRDGRLVRREKFRAQSNRIINLTGDQSDRH